MTFFSCLSAFVSPCASARRRDVNFGTAHSVLSHHSSLPLALLCRACRITAPLELCQSIDHWVTPSNWRMTVLVARLLLLTPPSFSHHWSLLALRASAADFHSATALALSTFWLRCRQTPDFVCVGICLLSLTNEVSLCSCLPCWSLVAAVLVVVGSFWVTVTFAGQQADALAVDRVIC